MKTRIFWAAVALMAFGSLSFGQGFCRHMTNYESGIPLTIDCAGGPGMPDGTPVWIYWDANSNGPDAADQLASVIPPPCNVNIDNFPINGDGLGIGAGYFILEIDFCAAGCMPSPPRFYLRVNCPDGTAHWLSDVHTFASGPDVEFWNVWTCTPCAVPCQQPPVVQILASGFLWTKVSVCLSLCEGQSTVIRTCRQDGEPFEPYFPPIAFWQPGCNGPYPYCDDPSCPSPGDAVVIGPLYDPNGGCWEYVVYGLVDNTCFCFTETWMAADIDRESFIAVSGDRRVDLSWRTLAERDVSHFIVVRNGETVAHVPAENTVAGAAYHYTDDAVVNGTTYTYTLRVVNTDNTVDETGLEVQATPSSNAAGMITEYDLHQNYPNPFNPETQITFDLVEDGLVSLKVFNVMGQQVAEPVNGTESAGRHTISFNAADLPSGMYLYTLDVNRFSATEKMVLLK